MLRVDRESWEKLEIVCPPDVSSGLHLMTMQRFSVNRVRGSLSVRLPVLLD
jgi:energy-converting hydrogenase Eha subunit B